MSSQSNTAAGEDSSSKRPGKQTISEKIAHMNLGSSSDAETLGDEAFCTPQGIWNARYGQQVHVSKNQPDPNDEKLLLESFDILTHQVVDNESKERVRTMKNLFKLNNDRHTRENRDLKTKVAELGFTIAGLERSNGGESSSTGGPRSMGSRPRL